MYDSITMANLTVAAFFLILAVIVGLAATLDRSVLRAVRVGARPSVPQDASAPESE
jgi:hypothetical protein